MSIKNEMINIIKHHYEEIPTPILNMIGAVGNQFGYSTSFLKKNNISFVSERKILNEDHLFNFHALLCADKVEVTHKILYL